MITVVELYAQDGKVQLDWQVAATLPIDQNGTSPGLAGSISGINNGVLIIGGGANFPNAMPWEGGIKKYHKTIFIFQQDTGALKAHEYTFNLPEAVAYPASTTTPDGIFYAGGENEIGILKKSYLINWDTILSKVEISSLPDLPQAITNASATFLSDKIIVAGGDGLKGTSNQVYQLDLKNKNAGWIELPQLPKPSANGLLFSVHNNEQQQLIWIGGRRKTSSGISELYADVFQFNWLRQGWISLSTLPYALSAGTGILVTPNEILLFGGERGATFTKVETLLSAISKEKDLQKKSLLIQEKNKLLKNHPGFSKEILLYNISTGTTSSVGNIPYDVPVTTSAIVWGDQVCIVSGEIRAGVRTPNILSVKINK